MTLVAEVCDFRCFANARQPMAYPGARAFPSIPPAAAYATAGSPSRQCAGAARADRGSLDSSHAARVSRKLHDRNVEISTAIATSPGKARSGCARPIGNWLRPATRRSWSPLQSPVSSFIWAIARIAQPKYQNRRSLLTPTQGGRQQRIRRCGLPATGPRWGTLPAPVPGPTLPT